ncbi:aldehyde-activating protein [Bacterioplanes sanyensis]|uniref:Aldehyde-activating protein n=1 Tax=Bacterioplanes sanyensis TaxID=1249553 RepID=A0A222FRF5_9GAMM|nr:GFA family protein [Bacterioplanes sanyensis]ASP40803.1 aldehyde-activating protein [Bacterioplanes sanyensis]
MSTSLSCLCGQAKLDVQHDIKEVGVCHCSMCRRWGGGPFLAVHVGAEVKLDGPISRYQSSDWANRGFCAQCGTHLFYQLNDSQEYVIAAGLYDANTELAMTSQIYIDQKPPYYEFANDTPKLTEAEFLASMGVTLPEA